MDQGTDCGTLRYPYILNCSYYAAFEILEHIYGGLEVQTVPT